MECLLQEKPCYRGKATACSRCSAFHKNCRYAPVRDQGLGEFVLDAAMKEVVRQEHERVLQDVLMQLPGVKGLDECAAALKSFSDKSYELLVATRRMNQLQREAAAQQLELAMAWSKARAERQEDFETPGAGPSGLAGSDEEEEEEEEESVAGSRGSKRKEREEEEELEASDPKGKRARK